MIHVGTSGFSYKDWEGVFYPETVSAGERLSYYAREFDCVEVNYSYYRIPDRNTLQAMAAKVPADFIFVIKANRQMTHEREGNVAAFTQFRQALIPWQERGMIGCVLAQFPSSFHNTPANRDYLAYLRSQMGDIPTVIEFRHRTWLRGGVFDLLRELQFGICCVDQPQLPSLLPPFAVATSPIAYVRLHGRNAEKWWHHQEAWERYDYSYSQSELAPWVPKIKELDEAAEHTFVFANNHWQGQAVDTARQLRMLLNQPQATG